MLSFVLDYNIYISIYKQKLYATFKILITDLFQPLENPISMKSEWNSFDLCGALILCPRFK